MSDFKIKSVCLGGINKKEQSEKAKDIEDDILYWIKKSPNSG